jgi:hypothetical protein
VAHGNDLTPAGDVAPKKVEWLWRERIPLGMITVVAGKPDQGKGLFSSHVAAEVSKKGGNVLYSAVEDDHGMMTRPRLQAAGADLDRILLWRFRLPTQFDELANIVIDNEIRLIIMDPFAAHLGNGVSRFSDNVREITSPLSSLAEDARCAVLITEHALKRVQPNAHPLAAIGGSGSGLPAAARMAFIFGTDPDDADRRILAAAKANIREKPKAIVFETDTDEQEVVGEVPMLIYDDEIEFDARRLLSVDKEGSKKGPAPDKRANAAEWLAKYLAAAKGPVKSGMVIEDAKQHGIAMRTCRRAADDLSIVKAPPGGGRNCTWDLPDELKKALGLPIKKAAKS